ncbi:MAG TPA: DUF4197 domain-containing protein [Ferruginibacter sp.]|nr:DUF4197 domain-containing protein [Ferruginibacter sp.]
MKKALTILALCGTMALSGCETLQQAAGSLGGPVTEAEAGQGIKEALSQGLVKSVLQLNSVDGFFKDATYKILLPPEAKKIENTLRSLGMNSLVDKAILSINRGAEEAVGTAKPIFADAIKSMTLQDAIGLIKNGDTSATHFFRVKTTDKLVAAFTPIIQASLNKADATKYYGDIIKTYNDLPTTFKKLNPDLTGYVTNRATNALFDLIGKEEVNIRTNFLARTTDLLKKVFGTKW